MEEKKTILLPADDAVQNWFEENIDKDCSASSVVYKFRLWLESLQATWQVGPAWVKASERLPGLNKPVKWRSGGVEMKVQQLWYMVHDTNSEYLSTCEWYDELPAAGPTGSPAPTDAVKNRIDMLKQVDKDVNDNLEAFELLKWLNKNDWSGVGSGEYINSANGRIISEAKLYQEFKQQKEM